MGDQAARVGTWDNYFGFDQGVLDANTVSLSKACRTGTIGTSLMHLGGGTVNFGSLAHGVEQCRRHAWTLPAARSP